MMKNPRGPDVKPVYFEERIIVSQFKLAAENDPEFPSPPKITAPRLIGEASAGGGSSSN